MKAISGALLAVMAVAALATTALAKNYTVDDSSPGWDTYVDYDKWTAGKTFMVGDFIVFKYEPYHNVLEVTEADYSSCATGNPIDTYSGGITPFELTEAGTRYFICGIPRHCTNGTMHVKITTVPYDAATAAAIEAAAVPGGGPSGAPLPSPPADVYADASTSPAGSPTASSTKSSASAPRYQQTSAAMAGLAFAALVAIAA